MNIYEYWLKNRKKRHNLLTNIAFSDIVLDPPNQVVMDTWHDSLRQHHITMVNDQFFDHVIKNNVNPVALGYSPISR